MSVRQILLTAATLTVAAVAISPASAQSLRYANQGDLKSLDPYTLRESTTIAHHGHVYEGLTTRDKNLKIVPALAESWETPEPTPVSATTQSYASLNENGTGQFFIESHQPGVKTVFKANPSWWGKPEHNLKEIVFTPIASAATRVAALLSGEVDIIEPVPLQDIARVDASPNAQVLKGPEIRTIFIGMDQTRDELLFSNVK